MDIIQVDKRVNAEEGDLSVWWIRNPPAPAEFWSVASVEEAVRILKETATNDIAMGVQVNVAGVEVFEDGEWCEWYDEDGNDIDAVMDEED